MPRRCPAPVPAGDVISYSLTLKNTGNVRGNIAATVAGTAITCGPVADSLLPEETVTCTTSYTVTQADIDAGSYALAIDYRITQSRTGVHTETGAVSFSTDAQAAPSLLLSNVVLSGNNFAGPGATVVFKVGAASC